MNAGRPIIAFLLTFPLCMPLLNAAGDAPSPEQGVTKPGYYKNEFFNFSLVFPESWVVVEQSKPHEFQEAGSNALVREGILKKEQTEADMSNTHNLLRIRHPSALLAGGTAEVFIVAEGIHEGAPFKTAEEYLSHTLKLLESLQSIRASVITPDQEITLGERHFHRIKLRLEGTSGTVFYFYYATIMKGYALSFIVSGSSTEQLEEADRIAQHIYFEPTK